MSNIYTEKSVYQSSYIPALSPKSLLLNAALNGVAGISLLKPFRYCDLACGSGETLLMLAQCFPDSNFIGIDANEQAIGICQQRANDIGLDNLKFLVGDLGNLDHLTLQPFDFVSLTGLLDWVSLRQQRQFIKTAIACLNADGLLVLKHATAPYAAFQDAAASLISGLASDTELTAQKRLDQVFDLIDQLATLDIPFIKRNKKDVDFFKKAAVQQPHIAYHDILQMNPTKLGFADFTDMVADAGGFYAGPADIQVNAYGSILPDNIRTAIEKNISTIKRQTMLDIILETSQRIDIFTKSQKRLPVEQSLMNGGTGELYVSVVNAEWRDLLHSSNKAATIDLEIPAITDFMQSIETSQSTLKDALAALPASKQADTAKNLPHLLARNFIQISVLNDLPVQSRSNFECKDIRFEQALHDSLKQVEPLVIPSVRSGDCLVFDMPNKVRLYLALGGDANILLRILKSAPAVSEQFAPLKDIHTGAVLQQMVEPDLPPFRAYWFDKLAKLGLCKEL